jgi:carboxymethylenebutenolidase
MGEMIEFPSNGTDGQGYLVEAPGGLPLLVIQEWWGLVPHIKDLADRFAAAGFTALAPDLYRGASTTEPDEAGKEMMALDLARAGRDLSGAIGELQRRTGRDKVGVTGFCMGGGLALVVACQRPDAVAACVPFYGAIPWAEAQPDYSKMQAAVQGHYAENDGWASPAAAEQLRETLADNGVDVEIFIYPGVDHAFFNDTRPEVYDAGASGLAWERTVAFLQQHLA